MPYVSKMNRGSRDPTRVIGSDAPLPLFPQWPRLEFDRGQQCRNGSPLGHHLILPVCDAVRALAALVTSATTGDEGYAATRV